MAGMDITVELHATDILKDLDRQGFSLIPSLLDRRSAQRLAELYGDPAVSYRARIDMARYNFGSGEYKYFAYPLPAPIQDLRERFYPCLAQVANVLGERVGATTRWPATLTEFLSRCHEQGQSRPTPLLLRYGPGDYNCLHQDLYGELYFPLQVIVQLSEPGVDFEGGELLLVQQRPRLQSRAMVVPLQQGQAAIIPVRDLPRQGKRGYHRAPMRHGVSTITAGQRTTLGILFHDAA